MAIETNLPITAHISPVQPSFPMVPPHHLLSAHSMLIMMFDKVSYRTSVHTSRLPLFENGSTNLTRFSVMQ